MGDIEKNFRDFLFLNSGKVCPERKKFQDTYLGGNHLLRTYEDKIIIYFLNSPDSVTIPCIYVDIFNLFSISYTGKVAEWLNLGEPQFKGLDRILYLSIKLSRNIQSEQLYYKSGEILSLIEKIVDNGGTKKIRGMIRELTEINVDPWLIENLNNNIEV